MPPPSAPDADRVTLVHATAVAREGLCALLRGPSGSGKSDLALRILAGAPAAGLSTGAFNLVSDDQVLLRRTADGQLEASAPATIAGRLEVRGVGIVTVPICPRASVVLVADLVHPSMIDRLPEPAVVDLLGLPVPRIEIAPFEASAPLKLALALARASRRDEG